MLSLNLKYTVNGYVYYREAEMERLGKLFDPLDLATYKKPRYYEMGNLLEFVATETGDVPTEVTLQYLVEPIPCNLPSSAAVSPLIPDKLVDELILQAVKIACEVSKDPEGYQIQEMELKMNQVVSNGIGGSQSRTDHQGYIEQRPVIRDRFPEKNIGGENCTQIGRVADFGQVFKDQHIVVKINISQPQGGEVKKEGNEKYNNPRVFEEPVKGILLNFFRAHLGKDIRKAGSREKLVFLQDKVIIFDLKTELML